MEEKIVQYLMDDFMKSLVINGSIFDNTLEKRKRVAFFWAKKRYTELSPKEKQQILNKIKD